jgi:phosphatidate cytidylyltransferase
VRSPEGLARRLVTAGALLAVFLAALLLLDRLAFAFLVAGVVALAGHEWGSLTGLGRRGAAIYGIGVGALCAALATADTAAAWSSHLYAAAAILWLVLVPAWLLHGVARASRVLLAAAGWVVLALAGFAAASLPASHLLLVLGLVWIADTAAYFAGNAFGRHRLAPGISPGKTWEGVAGALGATLIYAIICALPGAPLDSYVQGAAAWALYLTGIVLLSGLSIVGDLFESALKRQAGAKDSGVLLPGHGGILDRIDSVMPTLPTAALLLDWISRK